jgi:lysophospholipase L1-like esterase
MPKPARQCCHTAQAPAVHADAGGTPLQGVRPQVVLLGDSITQNSFDSGGWGAQLAHWYVRKADVVNRGFSGCALHTH